MENPIQDYAWGSIHAIPELLAYENKEQKPQAELWMGAHRGGPSELIRRDGNIALSDYIAEDKKAVLGEKISEKYGDLPFLFKVLAAGSPLSIQVHPNKEQAEEGYRRENALSIPLNAFNRNYKDDNHKPEIICALTPFWAMRGFRTIDKIIANFQKANLQSFREEVQQFVANRNSEGLQTFFSQIMALKGEKKSSFIKELISQSKSELRKEEAFQWVVKLFDKYPADVAIAAPLYLNVVLLQPGQALYLQAGELHAYLEGMGMELMASSDNVLRGGLTPKNIDVEELKRILNFSGADLQLLEAKPLKEGIVSYLTESDEFELSRIDLCDKIEYIIEEKNNVQILFVSDGELAFRAESGDVMTARKDESLFVAYDSGPWIASRKDLIYRPSIPE